MRDEISSWGVHPLVLAVHIEAVLRDDLGIEASGDRSEILHCASSRGGDAFERVAAYFGGSGHPGRSATSPPTSPGEPHRSGGTP